MIYDEEFTPTVDRALADAPDTVRIVAWTETAAERRTVEKLIRSHLGAAARPGEQQVAGRSC